MCDRHMKNARTKNKNRIMKKWIKENAWLCFMLVGISLMTWAIANGEKIEWYNDGGASNRGYIN